MQQLWTCLRERWMNAQLALIKLHLKDKHIFIEGIHSAPKSMTPNSLLICNSKGNMDRKIVKTRNETHTSVVFQHIHFVDPK